ncbi:MAG: 50S ribosomal protein L4 [Candidatus Terrybacteria bacterium RIFCSPHIGHO2_01_FULL_48_17]|uniref:Large ribosomal subunit protein uL4 n=1 Tax=Candidatus Terrybacteria bacterium RIFCSPHIGHO2_01_FULL_48_17 TaxID=1802362 RepID=A0A1G2PMU6_9BACT|nr:MAG: 50S ribosomal protein L4 [Candidatus Terrybacteria bacterium RIFCSPHIGHO2_01_FULL_48_17]OHA52844.1 MAG: 50S ribosomal protein L4 [Candidatus Terrybacteria bacterium RIFCSPLOWO2_01_FULL_48_14]
MKVKVYTKEGKQNGTVELPDSVFGVPMNNDLLHQAMSVMLSRRRQPRAHTKTREEVRGGGRKPWRQKGTGFARHGSRRSPIWKGGGVTFGPRKDKRFAKRIPDAMKKKALAVALSQKARDEELAVIEKISVSQPKTKEAALLLTTLLASIFKVEKKAKKPSVLIAFAKENQGQAFRAVRNIPYAQAFRPENLNLLEVLEYRYILIPKETVDDLVKRF